MMRFRQCAALVIAGLLGGAADGSQEGDVNSFCFPTGGLPPGAWIWVTALDASGEVWCAPNPTVRFLKNWTMGRRENPLVAASNNGEAPILDEREPCTECTDVLHHQTQSA